MQTVERHGGPSHYVRPDRVYRTSVIQSTMNYDPGRDVDAVAASFTQYPMDMGLNGLRGPGWWDRLRARWHGWWTKHHIKAAASSAAAAQAAVMPPGQQMVPPGQMMQMSGPGDFMPGAWDPAHGIAYAQIGREIAPHLIGMAQTAAQMVADGVPVDAARSQAATSMEHWWNMRWNG